MSSERRRPSMKKRTRGVTKTTAGSTGNLETQPANKKPAITNQSQAFSCALRHTFHRHRCIGAANAYSVVPRTLTGSDCWLHCRSAVTPIQAPTLANRTHLVPSRAARFLDVPKFIFFHRERDLVHNASSRCACASRCVSAYATDIAELSSRERYCVYLPSSRARVSADRAAWSSRSNR